MVFLSFVRFDRQLEHKQFEDYLNLLPRPIQQQVLKYRRWQDAQAALFGKLLLQEGARLHFQRENILSDIQYTSWKRPFVEGDLDFNISHAGEMVVCAISNTVRVGIDIEKIVPLDLPAYRQQMTPAEWAEISRADDPICAFYHYWTRKEAAIKADGRGMGIPLQEIRLSGQSAWIETQEWHLQHLPLAAGYNCYLATQNRVDEILEFDAGNLLAGLANQPIPPTPACSTTGRGICCTISAAGPIRTTARTIPCFGR